MDAADALFLRLALQRGWIDAETSRKTLRRLAELRERGIPKSAEDAIRESGVLDETRLRVLRRVLSRFTQRARIGDYAVCRRIGIGGTGTVFEARHRRTERLVALKVLFPRLEKAPGMAEQFLREARALALIDHPNVVHAYDAGKDGALYYIAMELVEGEDLARRLKSTGPLSPREALDVLIPVADALAEIHRRGLVHRDVKPGNILVSAEGVVKLVDLGLFIADDRAQSVLGGMVLGTPSFMSPEQIRGERRIDARSDLYSFGVTLFNLLTGRMPFERDSAMELIRAHLEDAPMDPRDFDLTIPDELAKLILELLAKNPQRRPASAADVLARLEALRVRLEPPPPPLRRLLAELAERPLLSSLAVLLVSTLLALLAFRIFAGADPAGADPAGADPKVERPLADPRGDPPAAVVAPGESETPVARDLEPPRPVDDTVTRRRIFEVARDALVEARRGALDGMRSIGEAIDRAIPELSGSGGARDARPPLDAVPDPDTISSPRVVVPERLASWAARREAGLDQSFLEVLRALPETRRVELITRDRSAGDAPTPGVFLVDPAPGSSLVLSRVDTGERIEIENVHWISRIEWGGLSAGRPAEAAAGLILAGEPAWALDVCEALGVELSADESDALHVAARAPELESRTRAPGRDLVEARFRASLQWARRVLAARRAFEAGDWARSRDLHGALVGESVVPDSARGSRERWVEALGRSSELAFLATGIFTTPVEITDPLEGLGVRIAWSFDGRDALGDFRLRGERWRVREGRLEALGKSVGSRVDSVAVFSLPMRIEGLWAPVPGSDTRARGRLAVWVGERGFGIGGPSGDV